MNSGVFTVPTAPFLKTNLLTAQTDSMKLNV